LIINILLQDFKGAEVVKTYSELIIAFVPCVFLILMYVNRLH